MRRLIVLLPLLLLLSGWTHGQAPVGRSLITCCNIQSFIWMNYVLGMQSMQPTSAGVPWVAQLNSENYPADTSSLTYEFFGNFLIPNSYVAAGGHFILDWQGSQGTVGAPGMKLIQGTVLYNTANCPASTSFVPGGVGNTSYMLTYGTNGCIEFSVDNTAATSINLHFLSGACYGTGCAGGTHFTNVRIYRASDYAAINSTNCTVKLQCLNPDFVAAIKTLNPQILRLSLVAGAVDGAATGVGLPTGTGAACNLPVAASPDLPVTNISYFNGYWNPCVWAGTISSADGLSYAVTLAGATLTDGQMIHGQFNHVQGATSGLTLTLNGGAAVPLNLLSAGNFSSSGPSSITANSIWTLIYDAALGMWLAGSNGISGPISQAIPILVQIAMANQLGIDLWTSIPAHTLGNGTEFTNLLKANLNPERTVYLEYANEVFNVGVYQTAWAAARGAQFFAVSPGEPETYSTFYGLRVRQIMGDATTTWGATTHPTLKRVNATTCCQESFSDSDKYRMAGLTLCGTSCGNATYQSVVGVDYNVAPNRPIDYTDVLSYADYVSGAILTGGSYSTPYASWSATGTISGTTLTVSGVTGTININNGVSYIPSSTEECDGVYITGGSGTTWTLNAPCATSVSSAAITGGELLGMQWAADNYAGTGVGTVNGTQQDALNWIDYDVRSGTKNGVANFSGTLAFFTAPATGKFQSWVAQVGPSGSNYGKPTILYEGGFSDQAPTVANCGTISFPGTAATYCGPTGTIQNALNGYRNSAMLGTFVKDLFNDFIAPGNSTTGSLPGYDTFCSGGDEWSLCKIDLYSGWWQSYYAISTYDR